MNAASTMRDRDGPAARAGKRYSIIVPLFDCRDAGMRALESALRQAFDRDAFEVVAVTDARAPATLPDALRRQCDVVVAVDADFGDVASEIALFDAGSRAARGEYLYFIEGHTVLGPDALRDIDAALLARTDVDIICGRRSNHARTRLGRLIGGNNDVHEARALASGNFTLGANSVIRRTAFDALGGFDPAYQRFNETVLYHRALDAGLRFGSVDALLCAHHNDAGFRWLGRLLVATGRAKARYYAATPAGRAPRLRHPVYRWLRTPIAAGLAAVPLRIAGPAAILVATALVRRMPATASKLYRVGVGFTDVAGFCLERSRLRGFSHPAVAGAAASSAGADGAGVGARRSRGRISEPRAMT
jgi:hypothetical protein